jgi:hypothetical protein
MGHFCDSNVHIFKGQRTFSNSGINVISLCCVSSVSYKLLRKYVRGCVTKHKAHTRSVACADQHVALLAGYNV